MSTLTRFLADRAGPDAAIVEGETRVSYAALDEAARRAAAGLAALGVGPGDRVALWLPNGVEWLALFFACARLGAIAISVNTRFRSAEVADILARGGARVLAVRPGFRQIDFAGILAEIDPGLLPALAAVVTVGPEAAVALPGRRTIRYDDLVARPPHGADHATADAGCVVFTTSGTTKAPKLVLHRQSAMVTHAEDVARHFGWHAPDTVVLQAIPLCGVFGFTQALGTLAAGRPLVNMPVFEGTEAAALIRRHRVSHLVGPDDIVDRLLAASDEPRPYPSIRFIGFARFNPALPDIVERADRRGVRLRAPYGMSEAMALFSLQADDSPDRGLAGGIPVSALGEIRIRDPETRALLPDGEVGEIGLRGPSVMKEYLGDPEATARAFADGFLWTGDLGYRRPDGGFVFLSRMGDVLRLGGFLVGPGEIEAHLLEHPAIDGCQVVGIVRRSGTRAIAFVTAKAGAAFDEAALVAWCRGGLAGYKVPARILPLAEFPVTAGANGVKVQRARLRAMAEGLDEDCGGQPHPLSQ